MATTTVTITLEDGQLQAIRKRIAAKKSTSVSGFIQRAVQKSLDAEAEFIAMTDEIFEATGGPLTEEERSWARKVLSTREDRGRSGRRKAT
ncbi:MAG: hypothetical protein U0Q16_10400 [Bryobacteraceae bacterium]